MPYSLTMPDALSLTPHGNGRLETSLYVESAARLCSLLRPGIRSSRDSSNHWLEVVTPGVWEID